MTTLKEALQGVADVLEGGGAFELRGGNYEAFEARRGDKVAYVVTPTPGVGGGTVALATIPELINQMATMAPLDAWEAVEGQPAQSQGEPES